MDIPQAPQARISTDSHNELANLLTNLGLSFSNLYSLESKLRSGSFGSVYTCKRKLSAEGDKDKLYAVKVMARNKVKEKDIYREVEMLKLMTDNELDDDRLLMFLDFFVSSDNFHLVTEYCSGGDVYDRLSKRVFYTEENARDLAVNLLKAVHALHSFAIVHRDIKPENLLLKSMESDTDIKIADFGFATKLPPSGKLLTRCGTPSFVAPELLFAKGYNESADMWSVGVTLYILLGGYPPFQGKDSNSLFRKIRSADYKFHDKYWKSVSKDAKQLIIDLLTTDFNRRLSAKEALNSKWIKTSGEDLSERSLDSALSEIKKFHAKQVLRGAVHGMRWAMSAAFWDSSLGGGFTRTTYSKSTAGFVDDKTAKSFRETYELQKQLNKGSFATVWRGCNLLTQKIVAIKVVKRANLKLKDDAAVLNEVSVLQSLRHAHILPVYEFFEETDFFFIAMELLTGGDVFDCIVQKNQYTEGCARELVKILLEATEYMHSASVAHRDLKPQNLLISDRESDTNIKIADFGFAKRVHAPFSLVTRCGTPSYVAPEILQGSPHDQRVDMWSIGVIVYILLVGYPPFMENDQRALFRKIKACDYDFFEDDWNIISDEAISLIKSLLVVDPVKRWSATQALRSPWFHEDEHMLRGRELSKSMKSLASVRDFKASKADDGSSDGWHTSPKKALDDTVDEWNNMASAPL
uniref:Protein kinase domain-containing protein n=1 Tax=Leptocylindrus danicus TaxID=163516 RepID=A0A7S2LV12_9STRA|mmetsp:Transcript_9452/g.14208  ORF Transcript_9452/g.14208 Transcript_9452/m.14208 type:complete len:694 (+) Transcript_9452:187-2268(+)